MKYHTLAHTPAWKRLILLVLVAGVVAASLSASGHSALAAPAAWDAAGLVFVVSVLFGVLRFDADTTKRHALRENPGRPTADTLLTIASVISLGAVALLLFRAADAHGAAKVIDIAMGLCSVVISWAVVHTLFMLHYARLYYGEPVGGIDFNGGQAPRYSDFAYLAFTVGMTFQVSDTSLKTRELRATVLRHALLSYVFGTVVIAATINGLASLSK